MNWERVRVSGEGRAKRKEEGVQRVGEGKNRGREKMGSMQEKRGEGIVGVVG